MNPPRNRRRPQHPANRRRPRPSTAQTAARRHSRWLVAQLVRAGLWLRGLPARLTRPADTAVSGRLLRPWSDPEADPLRSSAELSARDPDTGPQIVLDEPGPAVRRASPAVSGKTLLSPAGPGPDRTHVSPRVSVDRDGSPSDPTGPGKTAPSPVVPAQPGSSAPRLAPRAAALGRQIAPRAAALGRQIGPRAAALGRQIGPRAAALRRQLGPLARRGAAATGRGLKPLLRLLGRFFAAIGALTVCSLRGLVDLLATLGDLSVTGFQRHRGALLGLLLRAAWWGSLALLLFGGRALLELHDHAPFDQEALPVFALGLGLCALLLLMAAQARLRWAAFALGLGHGGLLTLVWVATAAA